MSQMDIDIPHGIRPLGIFIVHVSTTDLSGHDDSLRGVQGEEGSFVGPPGDDHKIVAFTMVPKPGYAPDLEIEYQAHIQNHGWSGWVRAPGKISSFVPGNYRQIEALQIRAIPEQRYGVYYYGNMYNAGGTGWKHDGETCGTEGQNRPLNAICVVVYKKQD